MEEEIWKDVDGYEGLYRVSSAGRIFSIKNSCYMQSYVHHGYRRLKLSKNGKSKDFAIHRLVADAFVANPYNLPFINHKDTIRSNNRRENLEWCSAWYNQNYSVSKPVEQYALNGAFVGEYLSAVIASQITGVDDASISCVACGLRGKTAGGYIWKFARNKQVSVEHPIRLSGLPYLSHDKSTKKAVRKFDLSGEFIEEYKSILEASRKNVCHQGAISNACAGRAKTAGGFIWCYVDDIERIKQIESLRITK